MGTELMTPRPAYQARWQEGTKTEGARCQPTLGRDSGKSQCWFSPLPTLEGNARDPHSTAWAPWVGARGPYPVSPVGFPWPPLARFRRPHHMAGPSCVRAGPSAGPAPGLVPLQSISAKGPSPKEMPPATHSPVCHSARQGTAAPLPMSPPADPPSLPCPCQEGPRAPCR